MQSGEFGLQVRLPQDLIFSHLQNTGSHCDAGVTLKKGVGRKLGFRLLKNRLAHETAKRANHTPFLPKVRELTFLRNHREAIAAIDFFAVPTLSLGFCTAFSSSRTTGVRFCTAMLRETAMLFGWDNNCEKHGPTNSRTDSCYSTTTQTLAPM